MAKSSKKTTTMIDDSKILKTYTSLFGDEILKLESFSEPGKFYDVNKTLKTCSCPSYQKKRIMCKHLKNVLGIFEEEREKIKKIDELYKKRKELESQIPISLLKSAVQKAIRRSDVKSALRCSKYFLEVDPTQFLRRWMIIIIEDGILHPQMGKLAEILKNIKNITKEDKVLILNCVQDLASSKTRDVWVLRDKTYLDENGDDVIFRGKQSVDKFYKECSPEIIKIVDGIKYRSEIGGMKGDMKFLKDYYYLWVDRFTNKGWTIEKLNSFFTPRNLKYEDIGEMEKKYIIKEAADFHCTPLLRIMMKKPTFTTLLTKYYKKQIQENPKGIENVAKGLLWRQLSSINFKEMIDGSDKMQDVWYKCDGGEKFSKETDTIIFNKIKDEIYHIIDWYINKFVLIK